MGKRSGSKYFYVGHEITVFFDPLVRNFTGDMEKPWEMFNSSRQLEHVVCLTEMEGEEMSCGHNILTELSRNAGI